MAFLTKTDYFGVAVQDKILCTSDTATKSYGETGYSTDDAGSVTARTSQGENYALSNDYVLKSAITIGTDATLKMGHINTVTSPAIKAMITGWTLTTSAGNAPTLAVNGESVPNTTIDGTYDAPSGTIAITHKAQLLFGVGTLTGTGNSVTTATYTGSASASFGNAEGVHVSQGISEGRIEAKLTISSTGEAEPTFTAGTGWVVSSPLSRTNNAGNYPTYDITLIMDLSKTAVTAST